MKPVEKHVVQTNERLVNCVRKHPALYDHSCSQYSMKQHMEKGWQAVAQEMNLPAKECKSKWRNLRISYLRYLRQLKRHGKNVRPYYMLTEMSFMDPFVRLTEPHKPNYSTKSELMLDEDEDEEEDEELPRKVEIINSKYAVRGMSSPSDHQQSPDMVYTITEDNNITTTTVKRPSEVVAYENSSASGSGAGGGELVKRGGGSGVGVIDGETEIIEAEGHSLNHSHTNQLLVELSNPDMGFFRSVLPDMERMDPPQKNKFKLAVLNALNSIMYE